MGLRLDNGALQSFMNDLGLDWPAEITHKRNLRQANGKAAIGLYRGPVHGIHRIFIEATLSAKKAEPVLIHELAHARQAEDAGSFAAWQAESIKTKLDTANKVCPHVPQFTMSMSMDYVKHVMSCESVYLFNPWEVEADLLAEEAATASPGLYVVPTGLDRFRPSGLLEFVEWIDPKGRTQ